MPMLYAFLAVSLIFCFMCFAGVAGYLIYPRLHAIYKIGNPKVTAYLTLGWLAFLSNLLIGVSDAIVGQWLWALLFIALGIVLFVICRRRYKKELEQSARASDAQENPQP